mgnify:CR=1 FL=1
MNPSDVRNAARWLLSATAAFDCLAESITGDPAGATVGTCLRVRCERFPAASTFPHRCGLVVDDLAEAVEETH